MGIYTGPRPHFYQTRSAWSVDQGSNKKHSPAYNFAPTVTEFCVMWEGQALPHDTKFGNCRCKIVDSRAFPSWTLIHGLRWSGLIKAKSGFAIAVPVDILALNDARPSVGTAMVSTLNRFATNCHCLSVIVYQLILTIRHHTKWLRTSRDMSQNFQCYYNISVFCFETKDKEWALWRALYNI